MPTATPHTKEKEAANERSKTERLIRRKRVDDMEQRRQRVFVNKLKILRCDDMVTEND